MSRLKALGEKRAKIQEELDGIRASCEKENRARTADEKTKWASLEKERDELDEEIEIEEREDARAATEARSKKPVMNVNKTEQEQEPAEEHVPSVRAQIIEWQKRNKEAIQKIKAGGKAELTQLEIRAAASPQTPSNTLTNTITVNAGVVPQFESGIHDLRRVKPTLWDYLPKGRTGSAAYSWVNKKKDADTGEAAFIGPGVAKPGISWKLEREVSNAKKIAVSDKIAIELLDDVEGMESYVKNEMVYQLRAKANTTLMSGTESSTVPGGIQGESVTYSLTGIETQDPNNFDCIRAVVAQLAVGHFGGLPVTVFINPVDAANMDLAKSGTQGIYLLPPFSTSDGRQIAGALVVEDNNVTAGYFQAACLDLFKCLIYKDMSIALGWENDDFTKNLVTYICEMRLHVFHSENDAGAFIYDTFANVKALIDAEAA
ncbi:MAG TPA: phage major capsid protein [Chryseosolibacter sp.]|nr:phage major capsid protein [Chryseosolibacter sp.]